MNITAPFKRNEKNSSTPYFDNSNRVARILYRFRSYSEIFNNALKKGVPVTDLLRAQFPFAFTDAIAPPIVAIELTNYCNLKCPYCTSPLGLRKRGFMGEQVFNRLFNDLLKMKSNRIQLVGNGESSLHPKFGEYISKLAQTGKYVSLVTNGQWKNVNVASQILEAPLDLIDISIDAGGKEKYEASRINGSFDTLLFNLKHLMALKRRLNAKTLINIRLMLRPSQRDIFREEHTFWSEYCDRIMPQYIMKINSTTYEEDIFIPMQNRGRDFPKCSMPFKHIEIRYTGEVLMCYYTPYQIGLPGLVIGNVLDSSINEIWNCRIMKDYRNAHRKRIKENMPVCKGCPGT